MRLGGIRGRVGGIGDSGDPYEALLCKLLLVSVKDARQTRNQQLRREAWMFLRHVAPAVAKRLMKEEGINMASQFDPSPTPRRVAGCRLGGGQRLPGQPSALADNGVGWGRSACGQLQGRQGR